MTVTAAKRIVYAGDDLIVNLQWQSGTKKEPGPPINITDYTFEVVIVKSGAVVVTGTVTTVPDEGRIKIAFSELQTADLSGQYEMRLRYTNPVDETITFLVMPLEVKR